MESKAYPNQDEIMFSNQGLGQDSAAIAVLYVTGRLPPAYYERPPFFVFVDTGAEWEVTYRFGREQLGPYLARHGHELHWLEVGSPYHQTGPSPGYPNGRMLMDIRSQYMADKHPSFPMLGSGGRCTMTHKQGPLARFRNKVRLDLTGRTPHEHQRRGFQDWVIVGIAADETRRALPSPAKHYTIKYPLIELGLTRPDCRKIIAEAGLEIPWKSGCVTCPFQPAWQYWLHAELYPEDFAITEQMENLCNADRAARGKDPVYILHDINLPLRQAVAKWRADNPDIPIEDVLTWPVERDCYQVHWGKKVDPNQVLFDLESLTADGDTAAD